MRYIKGANVLYCGHNNVYVQSFLNAYYVSIGRLGDVIPCEGCDKDLSEVEDIEDILRCYRNERLRSYLGDERIARCMAALDNLGRILENYNGREPGFYAKVIADFKFEEKARKLYQIIKERYRDKDMIPSFEKIRSFQGNPKGNIFAFYDKGKGAKLEFRKFIERSPYVGDSIRSLRGPQNRYVLSVDNLDNILWLARHIVEYKHKHVYHSPKLDVGMCSIVDFQGIYIGKHGITDVNYALIYYYEDVDRLL